MDQPGMDQPGMDQPEVDQPERDRPERDRLNQMDATGAVAGMEKGDFSALELMESCLARVEARDDAVRAWAHLDPEQARDQARAADAARANGRVGPLHGIPVGIKDIIDTHDMPTENGSALFSGRRPNHDAACVAALRAAGAVIMGKTVTTELANTQPSKTRNPHNIEHTPGGSSSGSGAGVADGQVMLALGTQTGGSVIRPASFNGVYAMKPTLGLLPRAGVLMQSHTLDTVGVYGRSLNDIALITDCLSQPDPQDAYSYVGARPNLCGALGTKPAAAPRLAFVQTPAWDEAEPNARDAIERLAASLPGCERQALPPPFDAILSLHHEIFAGENAHYYGTHFDERPELFSDKLRGRMVDAMKSSARDYVNAVCQREVIYASVLRLLERFDAILCLSSAGPAPRGFETTGSPAFNSPWTYLGVPCISLPLLTVDDMPLGVQLVGARGGEASLMQVAKWLDTFER
ncbi:MAG: amidase [Pseudomonadota bacterium]